MTKKKKTKHRVKQQPQRQDSPERSAPGKTEQAQAEAATADDSEKASLEKAAEETKGAPSSDEPERPFGYCLYDVVQTKWPYLVLVAAVSWFSYTMDRVNKNGSHEWRMWIALLGVGLLLYRLSQNGRRLSLDHMKSVAEKWETRIYYGVLVAAIVFGVFNYFNFDKREVEGVGDGTDMAYYYLNTKYLEELGYFRFYAAVLTADKEYKDRFASRLRGYRDLRDYENKPTKIAFEHGREIKEKHFTKERWEEFKHDVDYFLSFPQMPRLFNYFFNDHGYNPPPTWAVPGYILASSVPAEKVKWIAMVDVICLVFALLAVCWAFGGEATLYVMLFFICTFSGRWPMISHCLLRFDWSSALVIAICLLKKERFAWAGAALGYAALNRIFPAIFFFPWVVFVVKQIIETRKIGKEHLLFAGGAAAMTVILVVGAIGLFGPEKLAESSKNLAMHNHSYSSHRVGLADLFVYDGEVTGREISKKGGMREKEILVQGTRNLRYLIGLSTIVFIALFILRVKKPLHELIHYSAIPLFCVTTPQINYYNLRMILIMWHVFNLPKSRFHQLGVIGLFAIEAVTQWSQISGNVRFATTAYTSIGLFVYYLYVMAWMGLQIRDAAMKKS